jgi:DNA-binding FadR family transcriptional regulator
MAGKAALDDYIIETLLPDLVGHDRSLVSFIIYVKLWHDSCGPGKKLAVSLSTLAVETGLSKSAVQAALRRLRARGYLSVRRASATAVPVYSVQAPWRR